MNLSLSNWLPCGGKISVYQFGTKLLREGITPGERYSIDCDSEKIRVTISEDGNRKVSPKARGGLDTPVLDIRDKAFDQFADKGDVLRVVATKNKVIIRLHDQRRKQKITPLLQWFCLCGRYYRMGFKSELFVPLRRQVRFK